MKMSIKLRVLIKRGEALDVWLAVCLERCIVAQASSQEEVVREFQAILAAEVAYGVRHGDPAHPLDGIEPAPTQYWDAFERASPMDPPEIQTTPHDHQR